MGFMGLVSLVSLRARKFCAAFSNPTSLSLSVSVLSISLFSPTLRSFSLLFSVSLSLSSLSGAAACEDLLRGIPLVLADFLDSWMHLGGYHLACHQMTPDVKSQDELLSHNEFSCRRSRSTFQILPLVFMTSVNQPSKGPKGPKGGQQAKGQR